MKCPKCGADIKEDASFCTSCGMPVTNMNTQVVDGVLNPAACLPIYQDLANKQKKGLFTGFSRVFRFEGNNYFEMSRLREYNVCDAFSLKFNEDIIPELTSIRKIYNFIKENKKW